MNTDDVGSADEEDDAAALACSIEDFGWPRMRPARVS